VIQITHTCVKLDAVANAYVIIREAFEDRVDGMLLLTTRDSWTLPIPLVENSTIRFGGLEIILPQPPLITIGSDQPKRRIEL
jgi:hypothetical protein